MAKDGPSLCDFQHTCSSLLHFCFFVFFEWQIYACGICARVWMFFLYVDELIGDESFQDESVSLLCTLENSTCLCFFSTPHLVQVLSSTGFPQYGALWRLTTVI